MACAADVLWAALAAGGTRPAVRDAAIELSAAQLLQDMRARRARLDALGAAGGAGARQRRRLGGLDLVLLASGRVCVPVPGFFSAAAAGACARQCRRRHPIGDPIVAARVAGFQEIDEGIFQRVPRTVPSLPVGTVKITYTSGTTGQPKGVCLDAGAQLAVARSLAEVSTACGVERHLSVLPLATLLENVGGGVYAAILAGACVDLAPQAALGMTGASGFDVARFIRSLHEHQPHSLILLPQLLLALVTAAEQGIKLPDSLRFVAVGGGGASPALLRRAGVIPAFEGYGLSECASVVCVNTPGARRIGTVGRPLAHAAVRLAADGEVEVRGARMLGYLGEPALAERLAAHRRPRPLRRRLSWCCTGARSISSSTAFGRNVNPEWVEAELTQQAPIAQAWVHGEALAANVAVIVARGAEYSDAAIDAAVATANAALPDYARVQRWLRADAPFTPANGLLTANGRLRRAALVERYLARIAACADLDGLADPADPIPFLPIEQEIDA